MMESFDGWMRLKCAGCGCYVHVDPELDRLTHHKRGCELAKSRLALRKAVTRTARVRSARQRMLDTHRASLERLGRGERHG